MKRSMSRQAEAERERRARIIAADGEYQASKKLAQAASVMAADPAALQLRLLQTVVEVAAEKNSTLVMPFPVELLRFFDRTSLPAPPGPGSRGGREAEAAIAPPATPAALPESQPASHARDDGAETERTQRRTPTGGRRRYAHLGRACACRRGARATAWENAGVVLVGQPVHSGRVQEHDREPGQGHPDRRGALEWP